MAINGYPPSMREIGAGGPLLAEQVIEETFPVPESIVGQGEIVAAMIDGEATVKTFSRKDGHIWLLPANESYAPIDGDNCEILGKVTAVLRSIG